MRTPHYFGCGHVGDTNQLDCVSDKKRNKLADESRTPIEGLIA